MATSGTHQYNATAEDIMKEALELIESYEAGEALSSDVEQSVLRTFEMMIKTLQVSGVGMWKNEEMALFLGEDEYKYDIGPTGDHATLGWVKTEVATAASSGASSVVIDATTDMTDNYDRNGISAAATPVISTDLTLGGALSDGTVATLPSQRKLLIYSDGDDSGVTFTITGTNVFGTAVTESLVGPNATTVYSAEEYYTVTQITPSANGAGNVEVGCVGDFVGFELDNGEMQWTNIGAALSTTLTLITTITDDIAVDNHVYVYTAKTPRPIEIIEARIKRSDGTETPLQIISRDKYMRIPNKDTTGIANSIYYDPQLINGEMSVWPACAYVNDYLKFTVRIPIEDITSLSGDVNFGQEWFLPLAWNLASLIAPKFGEVFSQMNELRAIAMLEAVSDFDSENTSSFIRV